MKPALRPVLGQRQHHEGAGKPVAHAGLHDRFRFGAANEPIQELGVDQIHPTGDEWRLIALAEFSEISLDIGLALHHLIEAGDGARFRHRLVKHRPPGTFRHPTALRQL